MNDTDARLWHPWLRINRVLRAMLMANRFVAIRVLRRFPEAAITRGGDHPRQV